MTTERRFSDFPTFWNKDRETLDAESRELIIVERLRVQLRTAYETIPMYRSLYDRNSFHPDEIEGLRHFAARTPVLTKDDLRKDQASHPPFGSYLGVKRSELSRILTSSGTTGRPTVYGISFEDWERGAEVARAGLWCLGVRPDDIVFLAFPFSLFMGSWGMLQGCEALGACVLPAGTQAAVDVQIELLQSAQPTVVVGTPSYLLHLGRAVAAAGVDVHPDLALVSGEPGGSIDSVRREIGVLWGGARVQDFAAGMTSELYPYFSAVSCQHSSGVHIFEDENYLEVVDPDDPSTPVPLGEPGAVVVTTLWRASQPMIRFWTGDEARLVRDECACGRTYPRLPDGLRGRLDDRLRLGRSTCYVTDIQSSLCEAGLVNEFQIVSSAKEVRELRVEAGPQLTDSDDGFADVRALATRVLRDIAGEQVGVTVTVSRAGTLPEQTFKAKRVIQQ